MHTSIRKCRKMKILKQNADKLMRLFVNSTVDSFHGNAVTPSCGAQLTGLVV